MHALARATVASVVVLEPNAARGPRPTSVASQGHRPMKSARKTSPAGRPAPRGAAPGLLERYGCGPIQFSGDPNASYDRHLVFDHVVAPGAGRPARAVRGGRPRRCATCSPSAGCKTAADPRPREPQAGLLPVDGVPDRPLAGQQHHQPRRRAVRPRGDLQSDPGSDWTRARRAGARRRPGQRRPGPAGRLLHRLAGDARRSRRSATACATSTASSARRSRTAARSSSPTTGCAGPTRGRSPGPTETVEVPLDCAFELQDGDAQRRPRRSRRTCSACPTTGRSSATAARRSTPCGCGARRRPTSSTSASSARRLLRRRPRQGRWPRRSRASSTPTTRPPRGQGAAVRPGVLPRLPARWPTSSPASADATTTGTPCPTRSPSSSTTRTRRWPSPS